MLHFITSCLFSFLDATTVVALITTLKNAAYLHSQRSAITVRASCTWWLTAPIKLFRNSPLVLREDMKLNHSLPLLLSWEKGEERTAIRLHHILRREGQRSQSVQAGHHKKLLQVSYLHHPKNQAERGLLFRKGKKLKAFFITFHFLYPLGMSTSCKYRGNNFIISSWPGILTTVEELWIFFFFNRQITPSKIHLSRVRYVLPSVYVCMSVHARVCLHIYEYIFFPSEHSPDPTIHYCEAIDTVPVNVAELIPRIGFQTFKKKPKTNKKTQEISPNRNKNTWKTTHRTEIKTVTSLVNQRIRSYFKAAIWY